MLSIGPTSEESEATAQHIAYLQKLLNRGLLILAGRTQNTDETSFGIVIFEAESDAHADQIMMNDSVIKGGVMNAWLFPYNVAILHG